VEFAKNPDTAWHIKFQWDNEKAGHEHRLQQARHFIKVFVDVEDVGGSALEYQVYVSLESDRKTGGYRATREVLSDEDLKNQLLMQAKRDMLYWKNRYRTLEVLAPVFRAIEAIA
jgi:hypothetical protein